MASIRYATSCHVKCTSSPSTRRRAGGPFGGALESIPIATSHADGCPFAHTRCSLFARSSPSRWQEKPNPKKISELRPNRPIRLSTQTTRKPYCPRLHQCRPTLTSRPRARLASRRGSRSDPCPIIFGAPWGARGVTNSEEPFQVDWENLDDHLAPLKERLAGCGKTPCPPANKMIQG